MRTRGDARKFGRIEDVWRTVAAVIEELDATDRCVEYSVNHAVRSYDWLQSWLAAAIQDGAEIRYVVDPDHLGLVRVDFAATVKDTDG